MAPPLDCARATRLGTVKATTRCDPRRPPGQRLKRASPATALPSTLVRVNVVKQRLGGGGAVCHGRLRPAGKPSAEFQTTFMTSGVAPCFCRRACFLQCYFLRHSASQDVQSFASAAARRPQEHAPQINPQSDWNRVEAATLLERALGRHPPSTHGSARMRACPVPSGVRVRAPPST